MTKSLGDFDAGAVIYGKFTTYRPSTGAAFTLGGTPALSAYKDNSTTQSASGVTLTADFDSVTGLNHFAIDTGADGTFYSGGSFFDVVITAGTVDGVSVVGSVVGSFTIRKNSALKPATAGRTLVVDAAGLADANTVKIGPSGSGTAQTARDIGTSVLLSSGTGTGQISLSSGAVLLQPTQTGVTIPAVTTLTNAPSDSSGTAALLSRLTPTRAGYLDNLSGGAVALASGVTVSTNNDKTGYALSSAGTQAIWDALTSALTTAGTVGKLLVDNINATISSRLASAGYTAPDNAAITGIKAKTDGLTFTQAGNVNANIQYVNDVQVAGDGQPGTEWGPA